MSCPAPLLLGKRPPPSNFKSSRPISGDRKGMGGAKNLTYIRYPLAFLHQNLERTNTLTLTLIVLIIIRSPVDRSHLRFIFLLIQSQCNLPLNTRKHSKGVVGTPTVDAGSFVDGGCHYDKEVLKVFFKLSEKGVEFLLLVVIHIRHCTSVALPFSSFTFDTALVSTFFIHSSLY